MMTRYEFTVESPAERIPNIGRALGSVTGTHMRTHQQWEQGFVQATLEGTFPKLRKFSLPNFRRSGAVAQRV